LKINYIQNGIKEISFEICDTELIKVFQESKEINEDIIIPYDIVSFNIDFLISTIYDKNLICQIHEERKPKIFFTYGDDKEEVFGEDEIERWKNFENENDWENNDWENRSIEMVPVQTLELNQLKIVNSEFKKINFESIKIQYKIDFFDLEYPKKLNDIVYAWYNEIDNLEKDYLIYHVFINGENVSNNISEDILKLQKENFSNLNISHKVIKRDLKKIEDVLKRANETVKENIKLFFEKNNKGDVEVVESKLGNIIFNQKIFQNIEFHNKSYTSLFEKFLDFDNKIKGLLVGVEYISPMRGNQKRILENKSESQINELAVDYYNIKDRQDERGHLSKSFLKEVIKILEIEGEIEVEREKDYISLIYIVNKNKKTNLADLGYGFSQLIPIIFKIINCSTKHNNIIIIEEPEANLHPNLQSKLGDIFVLAIKYFRDYKFIIETHSEYFIRKLQYLTAKNEIAPNQCVIYYFNSDKYVNAQEPKVKKIEIRKDGNLSDTFGPGFYDEATILKFDLINLNKGQFN
jgi:predicted ATP-dependent endonuclease of OLD family